MDLRVVHDPSSKLPNTAPSKGHFEKCIGDVNCDKQLVLDSPSVNFSMRNVLTQEGVIMELCTCMQYSGTCPT